MVVIIRFYFSFVDFLCNFGEFFIESTSSIKCFVKVKLTRTIFNISKAFLHEGCVPPYLFIPLTGSPYSKSKHDRIVL